MIPARAARPAVFALLLAVAPGHAASIPVPGTTASVEASGFVDGLAVADTGGGPRQRPGALGQLSLLGKITKNLRTQLTLIGRVGGPYEDGHPGIMSLVHEFQNHTPSIELNEAWAELRLGDAQIRAGIQKFSWGKLDGNPPTDVLTPRDLHDPLVRDIEESKLGIPAVSLTYYLPPLAALALSELRASLVYIPIAAPSRIALTHERWFPPTINTGALTFPKKQAEALIDSLAPPGLPPITLAGDVRIPVDVHALNARPPGTFDAGGIAFRLGGTLYGMVDWDVSHYTGPETGPDVELEAIGRCREDCVEQLVNNGKLPVRVRSFLRQAHDVVHMTGVDGSTSIRGATVRAEVAVFQDRPYLRDSRDIIAEALTPAVARRYAGRLVGFNKGELVDPKPTRIPLGALFPDRDSVEWGIGVDYLIGGFLPILQVTQVIFTDAGPELLLSNPETRLLASLRKQFFQDTLELEVRGVYAFERGSWFVYPRASYRFGDHLRFRLGYLGIGGDPASMIGQFHDNDEVVFEGRYSY